MPTLTPCIRLLAATGTAVLAMVLAVGCGHAPVCPILPDAEGALVLRSVTGPESGARSLSGEYLAEVRSPDGFHRFSMLAAARDDSRLYMEILSPAGTLLYAVAMDGTTIRGADMQNRIYITGTASTSSMDRLTGIPLDPALAVALMLNRPPLPEGTVTASCDTVLITAGDGEMMARITLAPTGEIDRVATERYTARYGAYAATGTGTVFPRTLRMTVPGDQLEVFLRLTGEVETDLLLDDEIFMLAPPPGFDTVDLDRHPEPPAFGQE